MFNDNFLFCINATRYLYAKPSSDLFGKAVTMQQTPGEKSALIMITIVVSLFLVPCGLNIRCIFAVIVNDKCDRGKYRDLILVLNSAVNPLAYAFFKEDLKREINKLFCKVTSRNGNNRVEPCNKKSSRSILASSTL